MGPTLVDINQVNRVLDRSPTSEVTFIFMIGAAGSGKSTLARDFDHRLNRDDTEMAKFDDSKRWGMERWESQQDKFPDFESCATHFVADWISRVRSEFGAKKLVLCDVNAAPDVLLNAIHNCGLTNYRIILVQPSEECRKERLANDPTRQVMDRKTFLKQLEPEFALSLVDRCHQLTIPRIHNEESEQSIGELGSICVQAIRNGV